MGDFTRPKRSLGQNFLVDRSIARRIVEALPIGGGDTVLEVGPGRGALTDHLREVCENLVLVELDDDLADRWQVEAAADPKLRVYHGSILDVQPADWADPRALIVVGNIPYNITTPLVFHLLTEPRPRDIVLMVQKEVGERLCAQPGTKAYGALTVGVRSVALPRRLFSVPAGAFRPRPRVESVVVGLTPHHPSPLDQPAEQALRHLVRACFQWRRKQMAKVLRDHPELRLGVGSEPTLEAVGIDPQRRPDHLSPDEYIALSRVVTETVPLETQRS